MILNDLVEAGHVVIVSMGKEPSVDVGLFLSRDPLEVTDKIAGILLEAAVNGDNLAVAGGYNITLILKSSLCLKKVNCIFHDRFSFEIDF
jgi:hypothetical protein